jgi:hypothetical protein
VAHLGDVVENLVVNQLGQQAGLFGGGNFNVANFAGDVTLFIGQEKPQVAIAADQAFLLQPGQAFLDLAFERQFVSIDLVDAQAWPGCRCWA